MKNSKDADATQRQAEIRRALEVLQALGSVFEVRVIGIRGRGRPHTASGYFDDCDTAAQIISQFDADRRPEGIYVTLNEVQPLLLARSPNRSTNYLETTTSDSDIAKRRWLLLDFDPKRPRGISSTKDELSAAKELAKACRDWLCGPMNWPESVEALSGNGWHLLFPIDLPNDDEARQLVANVLLALDARFLTDIVNVDTTVHNAGRITKCYGTTARKGSHTPDRPHRQSKIVHVPDQLIVVPSDALLSVASMAPKADVPPPGSDGRSKSGGFNHRLDVARWLTDRGVQFEVKPSPTADGRTVYRLAECPFDSGHGTRGEVAVMQDSNGRLSATCMHNSCAPRGWQDFKMAIGAPDAHHYDPPLLGRPRTGNGNTTPTNAEKKGVVLPLPLLPAWKPFPVDCLPYPISRFVTEGAVAVGCDPSYIACPLIVAVCSAIGNTKAYSAETQLE